MTTITAFIIGLLVGEAVMAVIALYVHRHYKQAWQTEYRRLMGGIKKAFTDLYTLTSDDVMVMNQPKSADIGLELQKLYLGE